MGKRLYILSSLILALAFSCEKVPEGTPKEDLIATRIVEQVNLPQSMTLTSGDVVTLQGKGAKEGDWMEWTTGKSTFRTDVLKPDYAQFSFKVEDFFSGGEQYSVVYRRENLMQKLGSTSVILSGDSRYNVYGKIDADGKPIKNVWVTDGVIWVRTDENGEYRMSSKKHQGYVYISIPSGYEMAGPEKVFQDYWQKLSTNVALSEEHNFSLCKVDNKVHKAVFTADWHMRDAYNPKESVQIQRFFSDMSALKAEGVPVYNIPLGDLTWDNNWYVYNYYPSTWKNMMLSFPTTVFPVMGNHDYDYKRTNDFDCSQPWRETFGPMYYSVNLGDVHYLILDDVIYVSDGKGTRSTTEAMDETQLNWVKDDLSHIDVKTPVVVCVHVPLHSWTYPAGKWTMSERNSELKKLLDLLKPFEEVRIFAGHSHYQEYFNVKEYGLSPNKMYEYKIPPVGGTIWFTYPLKKYNIAIDGAPDGYEILEARGSDIHCHFQPIERTDDYSMRIYDMNEVRNYWETNSSTKKLVAFDESYSADKLFAGCERNSVLLTIFEADPLLTDMTLEITENGKPLEIKPVHIKDPLHLVASEVAYYEGKGQIAASSYCTKEPSHMFKVVASSASATLEVKMTDHNGKAHNYTVTLPKIFTDENKL